MDDCRLFGTGDLKGDIENPALVCREGQGWNLDRSKPRLYRLQRVAIRSELREDEIALFVGPGLQHCMGGVLNEKDAGVFDRAADGIDYIAIESGPGTGGTTGAAATRHTPCAGDQHDRQHQPTLADSEMNEHLPKTSLRQHGMAREVSRMNLSLQVH